MSLILDASVTMAWCFEDETSQFSEATLDAVVESGAHVPSLWILEVINVLLIGERRKRLTEAQCTRFLDRLLLLPIEIAQAPHRSSALEISLLARTYRLTSYDAAYLELAIRINLPLATQDAALATAAKAAGVDLFLP